ncbi:MAG: hypothetical protein QGH83_02535 [Candidatus Pacebacteria bacterium]|jgi:hypothetical protein|nr:hypothetical protein [Candidatus Paceibacterota bacterium]|tara:strand:+ start:3098 stop:3283 length:186 start_codon:yes stop_codon:yes gene_type:complete
MEDLYTKDFIRDEKSGALININKDALELYKTQRKANIKMQEMAHEISDLKTLVGQLINKEK